MLQIKTLPLGAYQTNCYLVWGDSQASCAVIDPGYDAQAVLLAAKSLGKTIEAIFLTHGHFDHVGAVKEIAAATNCKVYICTLELTMPPQLTAGTLYYTNTYTEGDSITAGGVCFRVLHTPGHTPGSVCLLAEKHLFSGDTLFAGSIGRTDHPGGDYDQLMKSIFEKLMDLDGPVKVIPGHGPCSDIATERTTNPFLQPFNEPFEE